MKTIKKTLGLIILMQAQILFLCAAAEDEKKTEKHYVAPAMFRIQESAIDDPFAGSFGNSIDKEPFLKWLNKHVSIDEDCLRLTGPYTAAILASNSAHTELAKLLTAVSLERIDSLFSVRIHVVEVPDVKTANRLLDITTREQLLADKSFSIRATMSSTSRLGLRSKTAATGEFIYPTEYENQEAPSDKPGQSKSAAMAKAFEMRPVGTEVEYDAYWDGKGGRLTLAIDQIDFLGFTDYANGKQEKLLQPIFQSWRCLTEIFIGSGLQIIGGGESFFSEGMKGHTDSKALLSKSKTHLYFVVEADYIDAP